MIQKNWQELIKPETVDIKPGRNQNSSGTVTVEPLERGFGLTIGNALRRVLLSSLQGAAITSIKIEGVVHEFTSIPGVREDVTDFILNVKQIAVRSHADIPKKIKLSVDGPCDVTAGMIEDTADVEIINKDLVLCTLDKGNSLNVEFTVETGKGYRPAAQNRAEETQVGVIPVDSIFSPVRKVSYHVDNARVGQITDYDKLTMQLETDGSVSPEDAVGYAARILQDQLQVFVSFDEPQAQTTEDSKDELPFNKNLLRKIEDLELSVRATNGLKKINVIYIGDLVVKGESDMLRIPHFGRKSLVEIKEVLSNMGLSLGMHVEGWPPENIEDLARKYDDQY